MTWKIIRDSVIHSLALIGLLALGAFYGAERSWYWLAPSTLLVAVIAGIVYRIEAWRAARSQWLERQVQHARETGRPSRVRADEASRLRRARAAEGPTGYRRRHIGNDPDTGDDLYTWEDPNQ